MKRRVFSVTAKEMIPYGAGNHNDDPIQGAEEQALNRVPVFMDAKGAGVTRAEENKDTQRQAPAVSGQISNDAVAERLAAEASSAAEEHQQAETVDRQSPGELQQIKKHPAPAGGGDGRLGAMFHMQSLFLT